MAELISGNVAQILGAALEALTALLQDRYGPDPWFESPDANRREAEHLAQAARQPQARSAVLMDRGRVVGVAHGAPGTTFRADLAAVDAAAAARLPTATFELRQLVIDQRFAGQGWGGRLHDAVLADVTGPQLLITHPAANEAMSFYRRRGWRVLASTDFGFGPQHPRVILGRNLGTVPVA